MNRGVRTVLTAFVAAIVAAVTPTRPAAQSADHFAVTSAWAKLEPNPGGREWEMIAASADRTGTKLYALRRADPPIVQIDPKTGAIVKMFGEGTMVWPHGIKVDPQGNIWVADGTVGVGNGGRLNAPLKPAKDAGRGYQVIKFSPDGKELLALGKRGVAGDAAGLFNAPTDIVVAPNGDIFVTDGHGGARTANPRVVKFSKDGTFIKEYAKKGTGPGEFSDLHCIDMDSRGRLFLGDRSNKRIQIFDQDLRYLDQWTQFGSPAGIAIAPDDTMVVADATDKNFTVGSAKDGSVFGHVDGVEADGPAADSHGNLYAAEVFRRLVTKIVVKK
jgi:DNA-binding beta-propeller fold protein YncE